MLEQSLPWIIKDTREKTGYKYIASKNCAGMVQEKLDFGDYAIKDYIDLVVVERKASVTELCNNLGKERERFAAELQRMIDAGVKRRYVVVEDYYSSIFRQKYTKMRPQAIFESIIGFEVKYNIHFIFAGTQEMGHRITRSLLLKSYKYYCEGIL